MGIAKHGAKMVTAVACARVPKLTVVIGRLLRRRQLLDVRAGVLPRFLWMWPNARISVMGGRTGRHACWRTVRREQHEARGEEWPPADEEAFKDPIRAAYEAKGSPYYATARLWDDGVIDPAETRTCSAWRCRRRPTRPWNPVGYGVFRM